MEKRSIVKKVMGAITGSSSAAPVGSEMPETPALKLPDGKISTATRKKLLPFLVRETGAADKKTKARSLRAV